MGLNDVMEEVSGRLRGLEFRLEALWVRLCGAPGGRDAATVFRRTIHQETLMYAAALDGLERVLSARARGRPVPALVRPPWPGLPAAADGLDYRTTPERLASLGNQTLLSLQADLRAVLSRLDGVVGSEAARLRECERILKIHDPSGVLWQRFSRFRTGGEWLRSPLGG